MQHCVVLPSTCLQYKVAKQRFHLAPELNAAQVKARTHANTMSGNVKYFPASGTRGNHQGKHIARTARPDERRHNTADIEQREAHFGY